jgi:ribosome-associated translation inhibitor RaiA
MKLDFRLRGWKSSAGLHHTVATQLNRLGNSVAVSTAQVVLEHQRDATPAWSARVHLAVPGPDLRAEARDHTVAAAWRKVMAALYAQVGRRLDRRRHRADDRRRMLPAGRSF